MSTAEYETLTVTNLADEYRLWTAEVTAAIALAEVRVHKVGASKMIAPEDVPRLRLALQKIRDYKGVDGRRVRAIPPVPA